jgi:DUF1680 family protein
MYVTGGIGSSAHNEGWTADFDLPNETAYAETCAAIGLVLWAWRMSAVERDARYIDVLEQALYNGVISGISARGTEFFYDNPLASNGRVHRRPWFGVACCPPNLARLITSLGQYIYLRTDTELIVNLFVSGTAALTIGGTSVDLTQRGDYPWDGRVTLRVVTDDDVAFDLLIRIPGWSDRVTATVAGQHIAARPEDGYLRISRTWASATEVTIDLGMRPRRIYATPQVAADAGRVALARGPLVYCFEAVDNLEPVERVALPRDSALSAVEVEDKQLGRFIALDADGIASVPAGGMLYRDAPPPLVQTRLRAVPYHAWDNRLAGSMAVWLREVASDPPST